jgi:resolvase-like protein
MPEPLPIDVVTATTTLRVYKDLRPSKTLIIWKIDRFGRKLRNLIDIVHIPDQCDIAVKLLTTESSTPSPRTASWSSGCLP